MKRIAAFLLLVVFSIGVAGSLHAQTIGEEAAKDVEEGIQETAESNEEVRESATQGAE